MAPKPTPIAPRSLEAEPVVRSDADMQTPEAAAERRGAKKMKVHIDSNQKRADVRLDRLEKEARELHLDTETPRLIRGITPESGSEHNEVTDEAFFKVNVVSTFMLATIMLRNPALRDAFNTFPASITKLSESLSLAQPLNAAENELIIKLNQLSAHPGCPSLARIGGSWGNVVETAKHIAQQGGPAFDALTSPVPGPIIMPHRVPVAQKYGALPAGAVVLPALGAVPALPIQAKAQEKAPSSGGVLNWMSENKLATAGIAAGVAVGLYMLFKNKKKKSKDGDEGDDEESFFNWKTLGIVGAVAGVLFGASKALGKDGITGLLSDKLGVDIKSVGDGGDRIMEAGKLLLKGELVAAKNVLVDGADNDPEFHGQIAAMVNAEMQIDMTDPIKVVTARQIFVAGQKNYNDFMSTSDDWTDEAMSEIQSVAPFFGKLPGIDTKEDNDAQIALRGFLRNHSESIVARDGMTVDQALRKLIATKKAEQAGPQPATEVAPLPTPTEHATIESPTALLALTKKGIPDYENRDPIIAGLSGEMLKLANKRENALGEEISSHGIKAYVAALKELDAQIRSDIQKGGLDPKERLELQNRLVKIEEHATALGELLQIHNDAARAYEQALRNRDPQQMEETYNALFKAKFNLSELFRDIFTRKGANHFAFLTTTVGTRIGATLFSTYIGEGIDKEYAQYIFGKGARRMMDLIGAARTGGLAGVAARLKGPTHIPTLTDITNATASIHGDMKAVMDKIRLDTQGTAAARKIDADDFRDLGELGDRIAEQHKGIDRAWKKTSKEFEEAMKLGKRVDAERLAQELHALSQQRVNLETGGLKTAMGWWERWYKGGVKGQAFNAGANEVRNFTRRIIGNAATDEALHGAGHLGILKRAARYGKYTGLVACFSIGTALSADEKTDTTDAMKQTALMMMPIAGTANSFWEAARGRETMTGRDLDITDRGMSVFFGLGGAFADILRFKSAKGWIARTARGYAEGRALSKAGKAATYGKRIDAATKLAEETAALLKWEKILTSGKKILFAIPLTYAGLSYGYAYLKPEPELNLDPSFVDNVMKPLADEAEQMPSPGMVTPPEAPPETSEAAAGG